MRNRGRNLPKCTSASDHASRASDHVLRAWQGYAKIGHVQDLSKHTKHYGGRLKRSIVTKCQFCRFFLTNQGAVYIKDHTYSIKNTFIASKSTNLINTFIQRHSKDIKPAKLGVISENVFERFWSKISPHEPP